MKSFPFDSQITGTDSETGLPLMDRAQSAETLQKFFENLFQDGIFQNYENCCQVSPGSGMNVLVNVGGGCCGGSIFVEENIRTLALQAAHESLDRIDAIVVRKNNNINYRSTDLYVVTGNPSDIPVAPDPTRSSSIHEIVLAHVFVARGTTSIPSYRITDTRLDSSVCGIATPMQEVDTSGIFEQYQAALDEYLETVASAIDNTLAGNLQNQITALSNNQADAFSKTSTYSVGDYCIYQNVLKKCIKDVETAGDYDSTCWEDTTIGEEFSELNRKTDDIPVMLSGKMNLYYKSSSQMTGSTSVDSKFNGCKVLVSVQSVEGTPYTGSYTWNVTGIVSGGKLTIDAFGSGFVSGHVLSVSYLLVI